MQTNAVTKYVPRKSKKNKNKKDPITEEECERCSRLRSIRLQGIF